MDERSKRLKRKKKRARHEATKKRTRNHKMAASNSARHKEVAGLELDKTGAEALMLAHLAFMSKKRR